MLLPAVKINMYVTLENHALNARWVAAGYASDCACTGLSQVSAYVR